MNSAIADQLTAELDAIRGEGLYKHERVIASPQAARVQLRDGAELLNFCANNYLGLADHPEVLAAARDALGEWGFGLASVRFICGTQQIHKQLEERLSSFLGTEDTILYGSCFDANGGLFETLLGPEDAVISDALNHASIIDGVRLCKAQRHRYANADMDELEQRLREASGARRIVVATDGVFSMDGHFAPLDDICELADRHGALVMVDDSHAVGFVGPTGRGTPEHFGVSDRVDIVTGTLGKALGGASGGFTERPARDRGAAAPALAALPLLEHHRPADRGGVPQGSGSAGKRYGRDIARTAARQHRVVPLADDRERVRHPAR